MGTVKKRILFLALALALTGLIVFTSLNTGQTYSGIGSVVGEWFNRVFFGGNLNANEVDALVGFGGKFLGHFWLFGFTGIFYWLFLGTMRIKRNAIMAILLGLGLILASLGETIQIFTAGRFPTFADVLLNFLGFMFIPLTAFLFHGFYRGELPREDVV